MIIKKPRRLHLDELIKWVWNQEIQLGRYYSNNGSYVDFEDFDVVKTHQVDKIDLFPIVDEIEITEDTIIYHFLEKDMYNNYREHWNTRINDLLFLNTTTHIWLINDDNSHTLVWENGKLYNEYEVRMLNDVEYAKFKSPKPIPVPDPKPNQDPDPEPDPNPEPPEDPLLKYKKIGVIGDSVAKGSLSSRTFGEYLAQRTQGTLQNEAVSSATMASVKDNNIIVQAGKIKDKNLVIIQGTDDDWLYNSSEGVDIGSTSTDNKTYIGAFNEIVNTIKSNNPNAKIIILPPTRQQPVDAEGNVRRRDTDKNKKGLALVDYVNAQVSACKSLGLTYYDAYHTELFKPYDAEFRKKYMTDGLHPNAQGHYLIYNELIKLL